MKIIDVTQSDLKVFFDYREDGNLVWKLVPLYYFSNKGKRSSEYLYNWHNSKHLHKEAFTTLDSKGYKFGHLNGKSVRLHRMIWLWHFGEFTNTQIDHINGIRTDNRIENLREVNNKENHRNMKLKNSNSSGLVGVYFASNINKWVAQIKVDGKQIRLGSFTTKEEAGNVRREAEQHYLFHVNHGKIL